MLFVAAAGNDYGMNNDTYPHYPSSYDSESLIAVLSTENKDDMSTFSNYGPTSVDIGAPGSDILSCEPGGGYQYLDGTSMATPHVAGACALLWSNNPMLTNYDVKDILLETADQTLAGLCVSGGRLNLYNAVLESKLQWLELSPESGIIAAGSANDVNVTFLGNQPPGTYSGQIIIASSDLYTPELVIPITMTVEHTDYVTELFGAVEPNDPNANDLTNRKLVFKPDAWGGYYRVCVEDATGFPIDPNGGLILAIGDEDYQQVDIEGAHIAGQTVLPVTHVR